MYELDGESFKGRLAEYLEEFAADIKTAPSRAHFRTYVNPYYS